MRSQPVEPFQPLGPRLAQPTGHRHHQGIQQGGGGGHGVVLLLCPPVGKEADVRPLLRREAGAAHEGQGPIAGGPAVLQEDAALPGELGETEQHHQIVLRRLRESFQQFRTAGGKERHL